MLIQSRFLHTTFYL